jgi:hypothetical protein
MDVNLLLIIGGFMAWLMSKAMQAEAKQGREV